MILDQNWSNPIFSRKIRLLLSPQVEIFCNFTVRSKSPPFCSRRSDFQKSIFVKSFPASYFPVFPCVFYYCHRVQKISLSDRNLHLSVVRYLEINLCKIFYFPASYFPVFPSCIFYCHRVQKKSPPFCS